MVRLSKRLQTISDMIPKSIVADVGSDHGKLIISLFETGKIKFGYAIENKKGPYNKLVKALNDNKLIEYVIPLFSDGISELPSCVNTIVLAGMGGDNIVSIIKSNPEKLKNVSTIVVDPHSNAMQVRDEITKLGYSIAEEKIIKERNIYYEIIKFIKSDLAFYTDKDLEFGPCLRSEKSAMFKEKYSERIKKIDSLLKMKLPENRIEELNEEKRRLESILWKRLKFSIF